jgi:hypothetical protein
MNQKIFAVIAVLTISMAVLPISFATASTPRMVVSVIDAKAPPPATLPPDLVVADVSFNPQDPVDGEVVTITATITNEGYSQSSKTQVQFTVDGTIVEITNIGRLKAGVSVDTQITQSFTAGTHEIGVTVDPNNLVAESNEGNNDADPISITVIPAGPVDPIHDVAITSLSLSTTSPNPGDMVSITVEVSNEGNQIESPTLTVSVDGTSLGQQSLVNLAPGDTDTVTFSWPSSVGIHTISAEVAISSDDDISDNTESVSITVSDAPTFTYNLKIEIDWMEGHYPTQYVLDYMKGYYAQMDIGVTFDIAVTPVPLDTKVSSRDFWAIERIYNTGIDSANGNPTSADLFTLPEKWVLFGTTVLGQPNVVGYCYTIGDSADMLAGNYIYIADQSCDQWAGSNPDMQAGAEAVVLMHEVGHAIGIIILVNGSEQYCSDSGCVMSYLNLANAADKDKWHYCDAHWATANLEYYD